MAGPTKYTAVRLTREPGRDEFDRHFSIVWETAHELLDPVRLFGEVTAQNGEIWGLWSRPITPGWRSYVDQNKPVFLLMKHPSGEPMMLSDNYGTDLRELSWTKEGT